MINFVPQDPDSTLNSTNYSVFRFILTKAFEFHPYIYETKGIIDLRTLCPRSRVADPDPGVLDGSGSGF